jgi:hypothetical protein
MSSDLLLRYCMGSDLLLRYCMSSDLLLRPGDTLSNKILFRDSVNNMGSAHNIVITM